MKVQLIVVRGKPEGKVIPLVGPKFKIGRGETCHLRPNSEQVSREHAEFTISGDVVIVRDLGSRNGTLVNGKALTTETASSRTATSCRSGPLTFAVSIQDARRRGGRGQARRGRRRPPPSRRPRSTTSPATTSIPGCSATTPRRRPNSPRRLRRRHITIAAFKDAQASPPPRRPGPAARRPRQAPFGRQRRRVRAAGRGRGGTRKREEQSEEISTKADRRVRG